MEIQINLNLPNIIEKVTNDEFGLFVSHEWKKLINPYTPYRTGTLMRVVDEFPFKLHYRATQGDAGKGESAQAYPAYVYNSTGWNFNKSFHPAATDHWDIKAEQAGQKDKLYQSLNNYLQR